MSHYLFRLSAYLLIRFTSAGRLCLGLQIDMGKRRSPSVESSNTRSKSCRWRYHWYFQIKVQIVFQLLTSLYLDVCTTPWLIDWHCGLVRPEA
jgi:hypothetical protein